MKIISGFYRGADITVNIVGNRESVCKGLEKKYLIFYMRYSNI